MIKATGIKKQGAVLVDIPSKQFIEGGFNTASRKNQCDPRRGEGGGRPAQASRNKHLGYFFCNRQKKKVEKNQKNSLQPRESD